MDTGNQVKAMKFLLKKKEKLTLSIIKLWVKWLEMQYFFQQFQQLHLGKDPIRVGHDDKYVFLKYHISMMQSRFYFRGNLRL